MVDRHEVAPFAVVLIKPNSHSEDFQRQDSAARQPGRLTWIAGELSIVAEWSAEEGTKIYRKRGARRLGDVA